MKIKTPPPISSHIMYYCRAADDYQRAVSEYIEQRGSNLLCLDVKPECTRPQVILLKMHFNFKKSAFDRV
jgi:hypothetical protein